MTTANRLTFDNHCTAQAVNLPSGGSISKALASLGMATRMPSLVIIGGASGLTDEYMQRLEVLFNEVLCPFVEAHHLAVIDGGTDSGVMRLMGRSRAKTNSRFPLLGVVVRQKTFLPGEAAVASDAAPLEPNHTHFLLVPGHNWGDESPWIAKIASAVSGNLPSATLLINGGAIALHQDVPNSLVSQRPVLVIAGSGRAADQLAAALNHGEADAQLTSMINTGLIQAMALDDGSEKMKRTLRQAFSSFLNNSAQ